MILVEGFSSASRFLVSWSSIIFKTETIFIVISIVSGYPMIRVHICGAQSTGKTTIFNRLISDPENDLHGEPEVARKVIESLRWKTNDFEPTKYPGRFFDLQMKIIQAQCRVDRKNNDLKRSYISDGSGIGPLLFCKMYLGENRLNELLCTKEALECLERYKTMNTLMVILEPYPEYIKEDRIRLKPTMDELMRITDLTKGFLTDHAISFETISDVSLEERVATLKLLIKQKIK